VSVIDDCYYTFYMTTTNPIAYGGYLEITAPFEINYAYLISNISSNIFI
jgi:hypothetical protein